MYELLALKEKDGLALALFRDNLLVEYFPPQKTKVQSGDIYRGKVERILPGLNAAFINLGQEMGFIYAQDVLAERKSTHIAFAINDLLKVGQDIVVQVVKEASGDKRPSVSGKISLAGEYIALLPNCSQKYLSRKITDEETQKKLHNELEKLKLTPDIGLIVRTNGQNADHTLLQKEYDELAAKWQRIINTKGRILYRQNNALESLRQDLSGKLAKVWTDDESIYESWQQNYQVPVFLKDSEYLKNKFALSSQLRKAWVKKVDLADGGFLVIDETEAMVVIDVNSGNFTAKEGVEETFLSINLQAAEEIARQVRLRNLAGIIIIDFIDMNNEENRKEVSEALACAFENDRRKVSLEGWSPLGLFILTRQKKGQTLSKTLGHACPHCQGMGRIADF